MNRLIQGVTVLLILTLCVSLLEADFPKNLKTPLLTTKIYYDTFLRQTFTYQTYLAPSKNSNHGHFQEFENSFLIKPPKFYRIHTGRAVTLSMDISDSWGFYAEASDRKWMRTSSYCFLGGATFSW